MIFELKHQSVVAACSRGLPKLWFKSFVATKSKSLLRFALVGCQKIITVCSSWDYEEMCTYHRDDLLQRQTPGPASRSCWIMPLIWCPHHCLCIISAGKLCDLTRGWCLPDATARLEHLSVAGATEHPWTVGAVGGAGVLVLVVRSRCAIPVASAVFTASVNVELRVQPQELHRRNTSAEGKTLAVLKQVLKLPSVSGWSPESRGCLSSAAKWSNCIAK